MNSYMNFSRMMAEDVGMPELRRTETRAVAKKSGSLFSGVKKFFMFFF